MTEFRELGLRKEILNALDELKFVQPFPVQEKVIPLMLRGTDVIAQAHTGTGKTAAFALPILERIESDVPIQALVLVPTRELAVQVTDQFKAFSKYMQTRTVSIYGGQSINIQLQALKRKPNVIVATPGRLIDHVKRGSIDLKHIRFVILDEADKMLDMGFLEDIKFILDLLPGNKQLCLFSATMPSEIFNISDRFMNEPVRMLIDNDELSLESIEQSYVMIDSYGKNPLLCKRLQDRNVQTIIFCSTKYRTRKLVGELRKRGFQAVAIHGDMSQHQRDIAMSRFRKGQERILVATDLASRGIDVPRVEYVINYDVPNDPLVYFHRIGRTARAGREGEAFTMVSDYDAETFRRILQMTEAPVKKLNEELGIQVRTSNRRSRYNSSRNRFNRRGSFHEKNYYGLQSRW